MLSQQLGFTSSWRMLTRDKGWIKPVLILALVGWIPILGQMAVLGFAYEWARLTAWGIDAAPKQRGVDVGKVLGTGARAFILFVTLSIVMSLVVGILTAGAVTVVYAPLTVGFNIFEWATRGVGLLGVIIGLFLGTFCQIAMLRATLYDSFGAGWRLDRLCQMIVRDFGGFLRVFVTSLIAGAVVGVCMGIFYLIAGLFAAGGIMMVFSGSGAGWYLHGGLEHLIYQLFSLGPSFMLIIVILFIAAIYACALVTVAMELVSVNACGQWFTRFAVDRWGVSSDPLPDGVPMWSGWNPPAPDGGSGPAQATATPTMPADAPSGQNGASAATAAPASAPAATAAPSAPSPADVPSDWSPAAYAAASANNPAPAAGAETPQVHADDGASSEVDETAAASASSDEVGPVVAEAPSDKGNDQGPISAS